MEIRERRVYITGFYLLQALVIITGFKWWVFGRVLLVLLALSYSFLALGLITSDFLSPNLAFISKHVFHISDRVSGLTLLALGNAVPDITSTYHSMNSDSTILALAEILGAVMFMLTVVMGVMPFIRRIDLKRAGIDVSTPDATTTVYNRNRFVWDLVMFAAMVVLSLVFLLDGRLMFWECAVMCVMYCGYVGYQVSLNEDHELENDLVLPVRSPIAYENVTKILELRKIALRRKIRQYMRSHYSTCMHLTLNDTLDVWQRDNVFGSDSEAHSKPGRLLRSQSHGNLESLVPPCIKVSENKSVAGDLIGPIPVAASKPASASSDRLLTPKTKGRSISADHLLYVDDRIATPTSVLSENVFDQSSERILFPGIDDDNQTDIDLDLESMCLRDGSEQMESHSFILFAYVGKLKAFWYEKTSPGPFLELALLLPSVQVALILSSLIPTPVAKKSRFSGKFKVLQLTSSPFLTTYFLWNSINGVQLYICSLLVLISLWLELKLASKSIRPITAFIVSIALISFVVEFVVSMLQTTCKELGVSESILGLTIFAWGNSIGDMVSNITFVKIGVLDVALGACLGGPLLYLVFGVGMDAMLIISQRAASQSDVSLWKRYIEFEVTGSLIVSCFGILAALGIYMIGVPFNDWRIDRKIGVVCLTLYLVMTGFNSYQEFYGHI
ncbi:LAMI_0B05094g1_1 [Lachancea mirantina]|uniref:LAMI_0B05094g1_1 n=1 Tax=Lachancea mirantina TaxID=1230905 RepID=A0A1G4IVU3_9SACH|nr:LAMI_0B05094g1_1 [Lachancea mirantina]